MESIYGALQLGLVFALVALAIFLTLRIIDFPDMTVNGSFTLGAAVSSVLLLNGSHPITATFAAFAAGGMAGMVTAFLSIYYRIQHLIAGIIVMMGLYSINLRIMAKPNISLFDVVTIFDIAPHMVVLVIITTAILALLTLFLLSEIGLAIRASGHNSVMGEAYGFNKNTTVITMVSLSNGLVALSGSLFSKLQGFVDISIGQGVIIVGLASVILGERLVRRSKISVILFCCVVGAIVYRLIITAALKASDFGFLSSDVYLVTSVLIVLVMSMDKKRTRLKEQKK